VLPSGKLYAPPVDIFVDSLHSSQQSGHRTFEKEKQLDHQFQAMNSNSF
jgi:hypothetical protein